jgi:ribonuclease T2
MKKIRRLGFAAMLLSYSLAGADWTSQNEQACDANSAGQFKYYTLSLSWSPEFCRSHPKNNELQCKLKRGFIVHGLWPECATGNPQNCKNGGEADAIDKDKIYEFMPSDFLIQHEWDTHGTCSGLARNAYFNLAGDLFGTLKLPRLSGKPKADKIEALFIELNPGLNPDEIYLSCTENGPKQSSKTLDEVRICFDKESHDFTRCESEMDSCRNLKKVVISPVK